MSDVAVRVENLGKLYHLGERAPYQTLRESLNRVVSAPFRRLLSGLGRSLANGPPAAADRAFWALKDVSFAVKRGEVVGIIGRNGAGKSTLLKILSRITEPTEGSVEILGRVGSLLEVGTGFHPELTGRENVFLNGAILGMKRAEIARKFDEIVAFAEIERFLDTPVKHYSSGLYMRLAFAVAAHLEPEVLLVDEVLAVGDATFQRKCLNKMEDVGQQGRAVLFVTHNMAAVTRLCPRAILLADGRVIHDGRSHQVVGSYLMSGVGTTAAREWAENSAPGDGVVRLRAVRVLGQEGRVSDAIDIRRPVAIEMEYDVLEPGHVLVPNLHFYNEEGVCLFVSMEHDPEWRGRSRPAGRLASTASIPGNYLAEGSVIVGAAVCTVDPLTVHVFERDTVAFQVVDSLDGDSARGDYAGSMTGVVRPMLSWTTRALAGAG